MEEHPEIPDNEGLVRANGSITPWNAADILAAVIDVFTENNVPITSRAKGMIGRQAKELLEDGFDHSTIVVAAVTVLRRGDPHNLHFVAQDLVMARAGRRMTRREYYQALEDEMELGGLGQ
jgi:hypothetical protein